MRIILELFNKTGKQQDPAYVSVNPDLCGPAMYTGGGKKEDGKTDDPKRVILYVTGGRGTMALELVGTLEEIHEALNVDDCCDCDCDDDDDVVTDADADGPPVA